jgi:organic hydroperoxide reductase OsmC/OhrA
MQDYPHRYVTTGRASAEGLVQIESPGLPTLQSAPPPEFGGPGDQWSPETFLTAAVADCFILGFRAIARASKLEWTQLECHVVGVLERIERKTQFTKMELDVKLVVPAGVDHGRAQRVLEKAEATCLITNSLTAEIALKTSITDG